MGEVALKGNFRFVLDKSDLNQRSDFQIAVSRTVRQVPVISEKRLCRPGIV